MDCFVVQFVIYLAPSLSATYSNLTLTQVVIGIYSFFSSGLTSTLESIILSRHIGKKSVTYITEA